MSAFRSPFVLLLGLGLAAPALADDVTSAAAPAADTPASLDLDDPAGSDLPPEVLAELRAAMTADGGKPGERHEIKLSPAAEQALMAAAAKREAASASRWPGQPFPVSALTLLDGRAVPVAGRRTLVNFWATWCHPCLEELPHFEAYAAAHPDVAVLTVSSDFDRQTLERWLAVHTLALPVAYDDGRVLAQKLDLAAWPTTFVLDPDGHVERLFSTSVKSLADLEQKVAGTPMAGAAD